MEKRKWMILGIGIVLVCAALVCSDLYSRQNRQDMEQYCHQINDLIRDFEFDFAKVTENGIVLYDKDWDELSVIAFDRYDEKMDIVGIRKREALVYFILTGAVDDEYGLLFVNDDSDNIMDGIWSLKKAGGNSYYYDTRQ